MCTGTNSCRGVSRIDCDDARIFDAGGDDLLVDHAIAIGRKIGRRGQAPGEHDQGDCQKSRNGPNRNCHA